MVVLTQMLAGVLLAVSIGGFVLTLQVMARVRPPAEGWFWQGFARPSLFILGALGVLAVFTLVLLDLAQTLSAGADAPLTGVEADLIRGPVFLALSVGGLLLGLVTVLRVWLLRPRPPGGDD